MRVTDQPIHDTSPASVREATGGEPAEWFDLIDSRLGAGHSPGEIVPIKLTASGSKSSIVLTHDRIASRGAADGLRAAWSEALTVLKGSLE